MVFQDGEKPFMCHLCGRFFSRKDNLKVHLKTHFKNGVQLPVPPHKDRRPLSQHEFGTGSDYDSINGANGQDSLDSTQNLSRALECGLPSMVMPSFRQYNPVKCEDGN